MLIKCWGARGSISVSGGEFKKYGGDTTCLEIRSKDGDILIVDSGTGIRRLGGRLAQENSANLNVLFTHTHWDHVQGFPFFKPIYLANTYIKIFGCPFSKKSVKDLIAPLLNHPYFPVSFDDIKAKIEYVSIGNQTFKIGPIEVTTILLNHPNEGLGYKFTEDGQSFVFLTDNELTFEQAGRPCFEEYAGFCSGSRLLIHDAEYTPEEYKFKKGWGHSVYTDVVGLAQKSKVECLGLFHHNQERTDCELDEILENCRDMLKDGNQNVRCFTARQDMEISLSKDQPIGINYGAAQEYEFETEDAIQRAAASKCDEIRQLKSTINALRNEFEKKQIEKEECVQSAKVLLNSEILELKQTITAQRATLAANMIASEEKLQEYRHLHKDECTQLQQTIAALRAKLEELNGK